MALIWSYSPPRFLSLQRSFLSPPSTSLLPIPPFLSLPPPRSVVLRVAGTDGAKDPGLLRRPLVTGPVVSDDEEEEEEEETSAAAEDRTGKSRRRKDEWVDWEDQILEDTVPLVGFVRMILHSGKLVTWPISLKKEQMVIIILTSWMRLIRFLRDSSAVRYECGDRLIPEHEKTITERLLPYHPEFEKKIGSGIDYITVCFLQNFCRVSSRIRELEVPVHSEEGRRVGGFLILEMHKRFDKEELPSLCR